MFDRFVRMAQARAALRAGDWERGLRLLADPVLDPEHRKVRALRERAIEGLLDRARQAIAAERHAAAEGALRAVLAAEPDHTQARDALRACRSAQEDGARRGADRDAVVGRARTAIAAGDLDRASGCAELLDGAARDELLQKVVGLRERAREAVAGTLAELSSLGFASGIARLRGARGLDRGVPLGAEVRAALARQLRAELEARPADERSARLRDALRAAAELVPDLGGEACLAGFRPADDGRQVEALWQALEEQDLERAFEIVDEWGGTGDVPPELLAAVHAARRGAFDAAAEAIAGRAHGDRRAHRVHHALLERAARVTAQMEVARVATREGRLADARDALLQLLEEFPGHEAARAELQILDEGADARAQEMVEARAMVRSKQLAGAAARAVRCATPGREGDEARALLREVQPQLDLVRRGVDQVRARLHGPDTGSVEGLAGCLRRLEQLREVQSDSPDVERLRGAIAAEIDGLEALAAATDGVRDGDPAAVGSGLGRWRELRDRLWEPGRLDAALESVVDAALAAAEGALANGRCERAEAWLAALPEDLALAEGLGARARSLRADVTGRRIRAAHEAQVAERLATVERDLDAAGEALERARALAEDEPAVRRVAAELDRAAAALRRVESLEAIEPGAGAEEVSEARRALSDLGTTPPAMRTRMFDLKRDLARAQGLEGAFLLRVDEAGEFLVFRQESATLGHVRDRGCDLPLQARLSSRHARLCRTMSFHGGQVDEVVAERGGVFVDGRSVPKVRLADGMLFRLGEHVELRYRLPSARSLTARLDLLGGFDLDGARALLWLKDRGRDGRILIGPDADAHVRVAGAKGTVELFAGADGRVRVRVPGRGEIDGLPFEGEHPVAGGSFVAALGVGFSIQPWSPADATTGSA